LRVVHRDLYLSAAERAGLSAAQASLLDYLVLEASNKAVGVGASTFSFFLSEARINKGFDPEDTQLLMAPHVGTDELFYAAAVVAADTRKQLRKKHRLRDICLRADRSFCFLDAYAHGVKGKERRTNVVLDAPALPVGGGERADPAPVTALADDGDA